MNRLRSRANLVTALGGMLMLSAGSEVAHADELRINAMGSQSIHLIADSGNLNVLTENSPEVIVQYPPNCQFTRQDQPITPFALSEGKVTVRLSFAEPDCSASVAVPADANVIIETTNHDTTVQGVAKSFQVKSVNGLLIFSETGSAPIFAETSNGSIAVHKAQAPLALITNNGSAFIRDSKGVLTISGANNTIDIQNHTFPTGSISLLKSVNGQVLTKQLRAASAVSGAAAQLKVKARAFSSIKFLGERRFSSFPGTRWHNRKYGKGPRYSQLIVDVKSVFTMR